MNASSAAGAANEPPWLKLARADLGLREKSGRANERRVVAYFAEVGRPDIAQDAVAWCAAAHFAWHKRAGIPIPAPEKVLLARAALDWGTKLDEPRIGCTAVFSRGRTSWQGHVGLVVGWTKTHIRLLSGNRANSVNIANFSRSRLLGLRWPPGAEVRSRKSEAGTQKSEIGSRKSEAGTQKSEIGSRKSEDRTQKSEIRSIGPSTILREGDTGAAVARLQRGTQKSEIGSRKSEDRTQKSEIRSIGPSTILREGDTGAAVARLQRALGVTADGVFGPLTRAAVRDFQKREGLIADGVAGPKTLAALEPISIEEEETDMEKTKSPLESLGITGPALGFIVWALNALFGGEVFDSAAVVRVIEAVTVLWTAATAIYGRWRATKVVVVGG